MKREEDDSPKLEEDADFVEGILQRLDDFDYEDMEERSRAQSTMYLMQAFGINTGYSFDWPTNIDLVGETLLPRTMEQFYTEGPRSQELYDVLHLLGEREESSPPLRFTDPDVEERFGEFSDYMRPRISSQERLGIAGNLHFEYDRNPGTTSDFVVLEVIDRRGEEQNSENWERYTREWNALAEYGVIRPDAATF